MLFGKSPVENEKDVIRKMITLYCNNLHSPRGDLCVGCRELLEYAHRRLALCQFGNEKPTCEKCPVHCYRPDMRENVKKVMRYAGPRMILKHPLDAVRHIIKNRKGRQKISG